MDDNSVCHNVKFSECVVKTLAMFFKQFPYINPRVIITSSMAAVRATDQIPLNGKYYTHRDWNTISKLNKKNWGLCYQCSKAESEREDVGKLFGNVMTSKPLITSIDRLNWLYLVLHTIDRKVEKSDDEDCIHSQLFLFISTHLPWL